MSNDSEMNVGTLVNSSPAGSPPSGHAWLPLADSPYLIGPLIAAGGMGSVHLGLKQGALGFRRLLAVKRLHSHLAQDPEFVARFKDEIRLVSRLNHPNVVQTLDVLENDGELTLVMEYCDGVTLHDLVRDALDAATPVPIPVIVGIVTQALHGLHSAHELAEDGVPLQLVHRDVSPQNIMIARDGLVKVLDFGIAKAASEIHVTRTGQLSGKAAYMSPEQVSGQLVDKRTDIFAAGVVLWEALTGQRLFRPAGAPDSAALKNVLDLRVRPPSEFRAGLPSALEAAVLRALEREPSRRFGSARDFALLLEEAVPQASLSTVASGVTNICRARLSKLSTRVPAELVPSAPSIVGTPSVLPRLAPNLAEDSSSSAVGEAQPDFTVPLEGVSLERNPSATSKRSNKWRRGAAVMLGVAALASSGILFFGEELNSAASSQSYPPTPSETFETTRSSPASVQPSLSTGADMSQAVSTPAIGAMPTVTMKPSTPAVAPGATRKSKKTLLVGQKTPTTMHPKQASACSPPTFTDADGIRHFKPECL
jgi:eukaryotic-like serine/threonine-protein kinase